MADNSKRPDRALLTSYIEKISAVQSSIQELNQENFQIRRDARADGFNMEAVNILSMIVSKSSHDGGLGLLQDVVQYAAEIGMKLDNVTVETESEVREKGTAFEYEAASASRFKRVETPLTRRFAFPFQLALGLGVAWMFIALLN
jgi:uncharacterized protein (UPF0335 family)